MENTLPALVRVLNPLHAGVDRVVDGIAHGGSAVHQRWE